ncbi:hypothetical protein EV174_005862, partial [Coemansia sp. RSA 2320]
MDSHKGGSDSGSQQSASDMYQKYLQRDFASVQSALDQYQGYKTEYRQLQTTLLELPDETEYDAMIPVGPLAFFPGKLVHTNEILVLLGDNWFVERSAKQAAAIAKRREEFVDEKIKSTRRELQELKQRRNLLPEAFADERAQVEKAMFNEEGEEIVDITEELDDSQMPEFHEEPDEETTTQDEEMLPRSAREALAAKRARVIASLSAPGRARPPLGSDEQRLMDMLNQFSSDDDECSNSDQHSSDEEEEEEEEGDAFSDEDRANAAQDDDEDDYNDSLPSRPRYGLHGSAASRDAGESSQDIKLNIVEKHC